MLVFTILTLSLYSCLFDWNIRQRALYNLRLQRKQHKRAYKKGTTYAPASA